MAIPVFESISSNGVGNGDKTVTPPPGIVDGDLLVAYYQYASNTIALTLPVGFTELFGGRVEHSGGAPAFLVGVKIASAESGNYLFTAGSQAIASMAFVARISGADIHTPINISGNGESTGGTTATCPDVVTTRDGTLLLRIGCFRSTGAAPTSSIGPGTEQLELGGSSGQFVGLYSIDGPVTAGATGTAIVTQTGGPATMRQFGITIAIEPQQDVKFHGFTKAFTNFSDAKPQSLVIPVPSGTALNNLLVTIIMEGVTRPTRTIPSGWALIDRTIGFMPMDVEGSAPGGQERALMSVFFRIASASEPADYTWSWSDASFGSGRFGYMLRFSDQDLTRPFDDAQMEGGGVAVPATPVGFIYRANAPTAPGSFAIRFAMGRNVSTAGTGLITAPSGDTLIDSDVSSESSAGIQVFVASAQENPLTGRGLFPRTMPVPVNDEYSVGTLTIAAPRTPSVLNPRVETVTRRVSHVQDILSPRFTAFSDDMVIPPTDVGDLLLSIGYFNPALSSPQSVTIPAGWTSVRITDLTRSRGVASVDRRIVGGSEPLFYTWAHGTVNSRFFQNVTLAIKGFNPSNPINVEGINEDLIGGVSGTPFDSPSVVTTVDGCLILRYIVTDQGLSFEVGLPTGSTGIIGQESVIVGTKWRIDVVTEGIQAVAGATGVASWAVLAASLGKAAGTIAIEPGMALPPGAGPIGGGPFRLLGRRWRVLGTGA